MRRASGEPGAGGRPPPRLRPRVATPSRCRRPAASRASVAEQRRRPGGERLVGPRLVVQDEVQRPSPGGPGSRRPSRRRTPPRRAAGSTGRPRRRRGAPNSSTTERPSRIASSTSSRSAAIAGPSATSSRWRDRGSTSNGRPSGPAMSARSPGRRPLDPGAAPAARPATWIVSVAARRHRPWRSGTAGGAAARPASTVRTWTYWPARAPDDDRRGVPGRQPRGRARSPGARRARRRRGAWTMPGLAGRQRSRALR